MIDISTYSRLYLSLLGCIFVTGVFAAPNPASTDYVDNAIAKNTYKAGEAISIINNVISGNYSAGTGITISGSVISATGQTTPYTGVGAILVDNSTNTISSTFTGTEGITVDNTAATITGYTAGTGIQIDGSTISATSASDIAIGDLRAGGVVVYVDPSKTHGLVLATTDQATSKVKFSENADEFVSGTGLGAGIINTAALLGRINTADGATNTAAWLASTWFAKEDGQHTTCTNPTSETDICYGGWFLPAIYEWQYVTNNITTINAALASAPNGTQLQEDLYWSSTSDFSTGNDSTRAYLMIPSDPNSLIIRIITNNEGYVRAMRKFYV